MKWLLENAAKLIGLLSFSLVVFTTVHDWGYFSVIGPHFRTLLSAYDYITNAIEWMPTFALVFGALAAIAIVVGSFLPYSSAEGFGDRKEREWRRTTFQLAVAGLLFSLCVTALGVFLTTTSQATVIMSMNALLGALSLYMLYTSMARGPRKWAERVIVSTAVAIVSTTVVAYWWGHKEARSAIERPANVYKIGLKGNAAKSAVVLRIFERGVLIWNVERRTAELMRWDQIEGLSRIVADDDSSLACRTISSSFCKPSVDP